MRIIPVDVAQDSFWRLKMAPGTTRELAVDLANVADNAVEATTFVANMTTGINGVAETAKSARKPVGATRWVDYPTQRLTMSANDTVRRSFSVTVPEGAPAGDYLAGIVLQNTEPAIAEGQGGGVRFGQTLRQIVAISIRVPGPYEPAVTIGDASLKGGATFSLVSVEVANTGNQNLTPAYEMSVRDTAGTTLLTDSGTMDSLYAGSETSIRGRIDGFLEPGVYAVDLTLSDPKLSETAIATGLPLEVGEPPADAGEDPNVVNAGSSPLPWLAAGIAVLLLGFLGWWLLRRRRRAGLPPRRPTSAGAPPRSQLGVAAPEAAPAVAVAPGGPPTAIPGPGLTVAEMLGVIGDDLKGLNGDTSVRVTVAAPVDLYPGAPGAVSVATQRQDIPAVRQTASAVVLVSPVLFAELMSQVPPAATLLSVESPQLVASRIATALR